MQLFEIANIEKIEKIIQTNLFGPMNVLHVLLPYLKQYPGKSTVINIISGWGRSAQAELSGYCASKFGLEGFTEVIAKENKNVLTAVTLDPRKGIATSMLAKCSSKKYYNT